MRALIRRSANWAVQRRLLRTLVDIGPRRLLRRLRYELRQRVDRLLPSKLALALARGQGPPPAWRFDRSALATTPPPTFPSQEIAASGISFTFLNEQRQLDWPISWNYPAWPRLWQFHIHYFDWARQWLDSALSTGQWPAEAWALEPLLDQWIAANPPGWGDGWHSYTLSLRSRNWIQLFRHCPPLATAPRLQSLWQQLCWLQAHPEHCHGGNHWLENLTTLAIGGLQFEGDAAQAMHCRAMTLLQQELSDQLLRDGGHQERSASYHLLMIDRLVELGDLLQARRHALPSWLSQAVERMVVWAAAIKLEGGGFPRFNDSAADACRPLGAVLASAQRYSAQAALHRSRPGNQSQAALMDLPETGWTLLRPGQGWELAFKCGIPCPPHLAAHAHSDLLSFDLWHHGQPVIAEVGTSVYGSGPDRQLERSSAAHNSLQLGLPKPTAPYGTWEDETDWIEPVDVWAGFRAGRKAQPHSRSHGCSGPWLWAAGSHDGYHSIAAQHFRWLGLRLSPSHKPVLVVVEAITASQPLHWRGWWHLGPGLSSSLSELGLQWHSWPELAPSQQQTTDGYIAAGFGHRQSRSVLRRFGSTPAGRHLLISVLAPQGVQIGCSATASDDGSLFLTDLGRIYWSWPDSLNQQSSLPIPRVLIEA